MSVVQLWLAGRRMVGDSLRKLRGHDLFELLELSVSVNSTAHLIEKAGSRMPDGNSTEGALLTWVDVQGTDYRRLRAQVPLVRRVPFDAEIKRMTSIVRHNGELLALVKGAPERVLPLCTDVETERGPEPISRHEGEIRAELGAITGQAMRGLALAYKRLSGAETRGMGVEAELTLLALVGIADPMRGNVPEAIRTAREAGIEVKMVLAVLAFCLDPPSQDSMRRPPIGRTEPFITRTMWQNILGMGLYFTGILILLQASNFLGTDRNRVGELSAVIFTTFVFFQIFNQFNCRSLNPQRTALSELLKSRRFLAVVALIVIVQVLLTQLGGTAFGTAPLPLEMWGKILLLTSTALIFGEITRPVRRLWSGGGAIS